MSNARRPRKHGKPIITSPKQGLEYTASLRKSKGLFADVSSGAAANGDGAPVGDTPKAPKSTGNASSGTDPQGNNTTAQTGGTNAPANGTSSTNTGNQTNNTTYSFDSQKVKNSVAALAAKNAGIPTNYWGEPIINNPEDARRYEEEYNKLRQNEDKIRAAAAAGIPVNPDGTPNIHSGYDQKAYDNALKEYHEHIMDELGINLSTMQFGEKSDVTSAKFTKAKSYTVVPDNSPNAGKDGYITQSDYDRLIYVMTHECGTTGNSDTELFGTASALLNEYETPGFYDCEGYNKDTFSNFLDGFYDHNYQLAVSNIDPNSAEGKDAQKRAEAILDYVLSGNRAFGSEVGCWVSNESHTVSYFSTAVDEKTQKG